MLPTPFKEFIALLEENRVRFLIVGGYAVAMHGYPRYTGDLDVFIAIEKESAFGTLKTFRDFGFTDLEIKEADFLKKDMIIEIGREPLKIQVMTGISGVTFEDCYKERVIVDMEGLNIPFISYGKIVINKNSTKRSRDKVDIEELAKRRKKSQRIVDNNSL